MRGDREHFLERLQDPAEEAEEPRPCNETKEAKGDIKGNQSARKHQLSRVCTCCPNNVDRMRGTDLAAAQETPPGVPLREGRLQQAARDGPHLHAAHNDNARH